MRIKNTNTSYGSVTKFFHWLLFFLITGMLIFGYFLGDIPRSSQAFAYNLHKLIGVSILCLMLLRLAWTLVNPKPALPPDTPWWEIVAERTVHWLIYIAIICMPLAGWIGSSSAGKPPHLGDITIGLPIAPNKALISSAFDLHNNLALIIIALLSIHVFAAFYHFFIRKDHILERMLPD